MRPHSLIVRRETYYRTIKKKKKKKNTQKAYPWDGGKNKKQIIFYYLHGLKTNKSLNRGAPKSERVSEQAGLIKGYVFPGENLDCKSKVWGSTPPYP